MANNDLPTGILVLDKPAGMTSHDVVDYVRGLLREDGARVGLPAEARRAKVGHAGTLDPLATGLLIVGVGREATKRLSAALRWEKEYEADVTLGGTSDTDDSEGEISKSHITNAKQTTKTKIQTTMRRFIGEIDQVPPAYAAIKKDGKKLYEYARAGQAIVREPRRVTIFELDVLDYQWPTLRLRVVCSSGTYIRALARDLGEALGVGGYLTELRRTRIGPFGLDTSVPLRALTADSWAEHLLPLTVLVGK